MNAKDISGGKITTAKELSIRMTPIVPNDESFKSGFEYANVRKTVFARYYLRAIDLYQKSDPYPQFVPNEDKKVMTLEHVLPENPAPEWNVAPDIASNYYKRLGNMCLLPSGANSRIGNKKFDDKKPYFKDSPYIMTDYISKYESWGPDEINERQKELAKLAPKVWPIRI
jgi:hypothetical protein